MTNRNIIRYKINVLNIEATLDFIELLLNDRTSALNSAKAEIIANRQRSLLNLENSKTALQAELNDLQ